MRERQASSYCRIVLIVNNVALSMIVMIMIPVDTELKRAGVTMLRCALTDSLASRASWKYLIILSSVSSSSTSILNHYVNSVIIININVIMITILSSVISTKIINITIAESLQLASGLSQAEMTKKTEH